MLKSWKRFQADEVDNEKFADNQEECSYRASELRHRLPTKLNIIWRWVVCLDVQRTSMTY